MFIGHPYVLIKSLSIDYVWQINRMAHETYLPATLNQIIGQLKINRKHKRDI
jgi:hypothetical protein